MARFSSETKGLYKRVRKYFSVQEQKTLEAQKGQDYHLFVATLLARMKEKGIAIPPAYSTVLLYQQGLGYQARVNSLVLLDEWEQYRYAAQCNAATTLNEKQRVYLSHVMNLFEAYCGNNATSASRATFEVNQPTFFRLLAQRYPYTNLNPIKTCTSSMQTFYSTAIKRNEAMVKNLLDQRGSVYVLVAGGFHEDGLKAYLRSNGCSYTAVLPAISDDKGKSKALYRARLFSQDNRVSANTSLALVSVFVNRDVCAVTMLEQSRGDVLRLYHAHVVTTDALRSFLEYFRNIATRDHNAALAEWVQRFSRELFESCFASAETTLAAMEEGGAFDALVPGWGGEEGIRAKLKERFSWFGMGVGGTTQRTSIFEHIQNTIHNVDAVVDDMTNDRVLFPDGVSEHDKAAMKQRVRMVMFLHDFGKARGVVIDGKVDGKVDGKDGRIHELRSEAMVRQILTELGYTGSERDDVCFLVKYHGTLGNMAVGDWDTRFDVVPGKAGIDPWIASFTNPTMISVLAMVQCSDLMHRTWIGDPWNIEKIKTTARLMQQRQFGPAAVQVEARTTWNVFFGNYEKIFDAVRSVRAQYPFLTDDDFSAMRVELFNRMYARFSSSLTTRAFTPDDLQWITAQGVEYVEHLRSSTALHKGTFRQIIANAWKAVSAAVGATVDAMRGSFTLLQSFEHRGETEAVTPREMADVLEASTVSLETLSVSERAVVTQLVDTMHAQGVRAESVRIFDLPLATADSWLHVFVHDGIVYISKDMVMMVQRGVVRKEFIAQHEGIELAIANALRLDELERTEKVWEVLSRYGMRDEAAYRVHYARLIAQYPPTDDEQRMECAHQLTLLIHGQERLDACITSYSNRLNVEHTLQNLSDDADAAAIERTAAMLVRSHSWLCDKDYVALYLSFLKDCIARDPTNGWKQVKRFLSVVCVPSATMEPTDFVDNPEYRVIKRVWDCVAGFFGVDAGNEYLRYKEVLPILNHVWELPPDAADSTTITQKKILTDFAMSLDDVTYLASGAQRFVPFAIAAENIFRESNMPTDIAGLTYDGTDLDDPRHRAIAQLLAHDLLYAPREKLDRPGEEIDYTGVPIGIADRHPLVMRVALRAPPRKETYRWLDIGSAPKTDGSPTLHMLQQIFAHDGSDRKFEFIGTDIFFPRYTYHNGHFVRLFSGILDRGESREMYSDGITYANARLPENDVMDLRFMRGKDKSYDFISTCKVLHHLRKPGEEASMRTIAEHVRVGETQSAITWQDDRGVGREPLQCLMTDTQQFVVENLLRCLSVGGYLFLDIGMLGGHTPDAKNESAFLMIRRVDDTTFQIYESVVPYNTDAESAYPRVERFLTQPVIQKYALSHDDIASLHLLIRRADVLAYIYQSVDQTPYQYIDLANQFLSQHKPWREVLDAYLTGARATLANPHFVIPVEQRARVEAEMRAIIDEARTIDRKIFDSLFNSAASIERAIADGYFAALMPPRPVRKEEFDVVHVDTDGLWRELIAKGYIDDHGNVSRTVPLRSAYADPFSAHPSRDLDLSKSFSADQKQEIYNILLRGVGWNTWWSIVCTQTSGSYGPQRTTDGHILQTIRNVDEAVDRMVGQGLVSRADSDAYKHRARRLMFFHDIGKAFDDNLADVFGRPQLHHATLSAIIAREVFMHMGYPADVIDRDCYIIENHAEPGMLGGVMGHFNEENHHEITERGLDVVEFAHRFRTPEDVVMLNCVALSDVLNRTAFFHGTGNVTKINEVCAFVLDIVRHPDDVAPQQRLVDYLWYRGEIRRHVNAATAAIALLQGWLPRVSITNMVAMVMNLREKEFPLTATDMETMHRLKSAA